MDAIWSAPALVNGPNFKHSAARTGLNYGQTCVVVLLISVVVSAFLTHPILTAWVAMAGLWGLFCIFAAWRLVTLMASRTPLAPVRDPTIWPKYTVLAALRDEAEMIDQLVANLSRLDYPPERLEGFLILEVDDERTLDAALEADRPPWLKILIAPPGHPQTKPRALNIGLYHASGDLLTVYDAEDAPEPGQLREAARRFTAVDNVACYQAPLRIRARYKGTDNAHFLDRQFAVEYAALFDVTLPGMARLGLPFPLGGTSNHFRVDILRDIGGWDPWNVTEDADLGFRLTAEGWRLGILETPTHESPPGDFQHWLPQRTRWLKGYMQTWGVHSRDPWRLGWRGLVALSLTLGQSIVSAMLHAVTAAWIVTGLLIAVMAGLPPMISWQALVTLSLGVATAWLTCAVGARRASLDYRLADMALAPAYWAMQTAAFAHALWRLVSAPHVWDKTTHRPEPSDPTGAALNGATNNAGRQAA